MKPQWFQLGLVSVCAFLLVSCNNMSMLRGSGNVQTETREVSAFEAVSICCGMHLVLRQAADVSLAIEADDNFLSAIESEVVGGELRVRYRNTASFVINRFPSHPVTVYVTMPTVEEVTVSGGGEMDAAALTTEEIAFSFSGGSRGNVTSLAAITLDITLSGGSHLTVEDGEVDQQSVAASGGSEYYADDLASTKADSSLSGGSHARLWVVESLAADVNGGSDLAYYGSPQLDQSTSGGSQINSLGDH